VDWKKSKDEIPEETRVLLKILELGNRQVELGKVWDAAEVFERLKAR
jgi:hypothetical protein